MAKIAFFSTQAYDRQFFENKTDRHQIDFFESRLKRRTVDLSKGYNGVCVFVTDRLDADVLQALADNGVKLVALRSAGFNHVDLEAAEKAGIRVMRVPAYSPEAVAEHAVALILTLARKTHKAYNRVRDGNFSLDKLMGFTLKNRTIGIIGTGQIGRSFCNIMLGFGCRIVAYDKYPSDEMKEKGVEYLDFDEVLEVSDILSLHCPLTLETKHLINESTLGKMKKGAMLVNTGRGKLVNTAAVIDSLKKEHLGSLAIDVYEEEEKLFFRDLSDYIIPDEQIAQLMIFPNVLITAHQGFFTRESMDEIARITLKNLDDFEDGNESVNEVNSELIKDN
ncbi:MAG: 2-hydroxyacid dehydrogenase [Bacteroidales bacterium]|nr:2-hydroxyacid dehydrogenase [Bacteroidales bacterium]